jgi:hypothetical protein
VIRPGAGQEAHRVLGVHPELDRVARRGDRLGVEGHRAPAGDEQLLLDEVDAGDHLGDGVLHLQPGVHLQEHHFPGVGVQQALDGAGVAVTDCLGSPHRGGEQLLAQLGGHRR